MKKVSVFIAFSFCLNLAIGQQFPNTDMENWTDGGSPYGWAPTDWSTVNNSIPWSQAVLLSSTCDRSTDANSGQYAAYLITVAPPLSGFPNVNGITTNGTINSSTYAVEGGVPYTARPDSLVGWYKCNPVGTDFPTIEWVLKNASEDTIGWARFEGSNTPLTSYARFSAPVVYNNGDTPTTGVCLISASDGFNSVIGSEVWVDDMELIFVSSSIKENAFDNANVYASANGLNIDLRQVSTTTQYEVLSLTGKVVDKGQMTAQSFETLNLGMSSGVYFVKLFDSRSQKTFKVLLTK